MHMSTQESSGFVRTVMCSNFILSSVHGWLTTSTTCTCTQSSSLSARFAKHSNRYFHKGTHHSAHWETIGFTAKSWYSQCREMKQSDVKQEIIWKIEQLEPLKMSSGIYNVSPRRLLFYPIFFILSITICISIWWTGEWSSSKNIQGLTNSTCSG